MIGRTWLTYGADIPIFNVVRIVINIYFCTKVFHAGKFVCSTEIPIYFLETSTIYPMKDFSTGAKCIASLVAMSAVLWFGGSIVRYAIAFDVFLPGTLTVKPFLTPGEVNATVRFFAITGFYTAVCYAVTWVFSIILMLQLRGRLKANGWLFMSFVLFYLASPIELYQLWYDVRLIELTQRIDYRTLMATNDMWLIFAERFSPKLSGIGFISILAHFTVLLYGIWQPLKKKTL